MSWVATAVVASSVVGGITSSRASGQAARAQRDAAQQASDTELRMFEQNREDQAPYREAGYTALGQIGAGTAPGADFNRDFSMADFEADPGYQFRRDEGAQAIERSAAARGGLLSGGTGKALTRYGQDVASQEYSNAYSRFNADRTQRFNRLASIAGVGQTSVNQTGAQGAQVAANVGNNITGAGNATAAGYIGRANAVNDTASTLGNFYLQNQFLKRMPASGAT
jgi:hypothetical protein